MSLIGLPVVAMNLLVLTPKESWNYMFYVGMMILGALLCLSIAIVSGIEYADDSIGSCNRSDFMIALVSGTVGVLLILSLFLW